MGPMNRLLGILAIPVLAVWYVLDLMRRKITGRKTNPHGLPDVCRYDRGKRICRFSDGRLCHGGGHPRERPGWCPLDSVHRDFGEYR